MWDQWGMATLAMRSKYWSQQNHWYKKIKWVAVLVGTQPCRHHTFRLWQEPTGCLAVEVFWTCTNGWSLQRIAQTHQRGFVSLLARGGLEIHQKHQELEAKAGEDIWAEFLSLLPSWTMLSGEKMDYIVKKIMESSVLILQLCLHFTFT